MDMQRTVLLSVIALLSFMLLTQWVAFKDERSRQQPAASRLTAAAPAGNAPDAPLQQQVTQASATTTPAADLPSVPEAAAPPDTAIAATDLVRVFTDTLHVAIDLRGGDIVEVALPRHLADIDDPNTPFVLLEQNTQRVYIAQSGLIGKDGIDAPERARYTSAADTYQLGEDADSLQVELSWVGSGGVQIVKQFVFRRGDYLVDVNYRVHNGTDEAWQANLFGQIKRDSSEPPTSDNAGMGMQPFLGAATTQPDDRFTKFSFEDMRKKPFRASLEGGWIAMIQHYFLSAWIPAPQQQHTFSTRVTQAGFNIAGFTSPAMVVAPGETASFGARFYAGPKDQYRLEEISPYLELSVDYGWLWWVAQPLFWLLTKIQSLVGNWGFSIILLTVLIKGAFYQLSATSYRSMANMRRITPKIAEIREQYADDKQKQSQAMMDLYRKEKINPLGGCLPILVQMPVFIALYWVLMESVELRHAPFILWIEDLSVMDPYFVLPLIMGASMWFMQKLNPPPPDPMQAKLMQWLPVVFTFFFLWFPAGLVLYWVVNNLLSMAQQYYITRQIEQQAASR